MKLESLTIIFENCESCSVMAEDVLSINLIGITKSLSGEPSDMHTRSSVKGLYLSIHNTNADVTQRLFKYNDITGIEMFFALEASQFYAIEWALGDSDYENSRQKVDQVGVDCIFICVDDEEKGNEQQR